MKNITKRWWVYQNTSKYDLRITSIDELMMRMRARVITTPVSPAMVVNVTMIGFCNKTQFEFLQPGSSLPVKVELSRKKLFFTNKIIQLIHHGVSRGHRVVTWVPQLFPTLITTPLHWLANFLHVPNACFVIVPFANETDYRHVQTEGCCFLC